MRVNLASIDLGFLYTKSIINNNYIITKSVVGDGKQLQFADLDMTSAEEKRKHKIDNISTKDNGQDFFISDKAIKQSDTVFHSLKDDRFNGDAITQLIKTAFGIGFGSGAHSTYIVSGLPASQYAKFKENIKFLFMGEGQQTHLYSVTYDAYNGMDDYLLFSKPQWATGSVRTIEGRFLPQPHAAAMDRMLASDGSIEDKALASKTVAVIDPGFGTSDIFVISNLSPVEKLTFSTKTAMNTAYTLISNKIEEKFGVSLPFYAIEQVMITKEFVKNGTPHDMTAVINWALKHTAKQLVAEIYNKWKNTHEIDHILVAGGGGAAMYEYICTEFSQIEKLKNSQWAIARGYDKWGRRTWKEQLALV